MSDASGRRGPWFRTLALLAGSVAAVVVGEGVLRLHNALSGAREAPQLGWIREPSPPPYHGDCASQPEQAELGDIVWPTEDLDVVYRLIPDLDTCFRGERLRTNAEGLRGRRSFAIPKPAGVSRILVLGDSQAFGWGVSERRTVGSRLRALLEEQDDRSIEVVNAAVPGFNTYQEAALFETARLMAYEPDCILVLFTSNDLALPFFLLKDAAVPARAGSMLLARLDRILDSEEWFDLTSGDLLNFVAEVDLDRVPEGYRPMVGIDGYGSALRRIARVAAGAEVINVADLSELPLEVAEEIVRLQAELGIHHLATSWPRARRFQLDPEADPHPNPAAHMKLARELAGMLSEGGFCGLADPVRIETGEGVGG